MPRCIMPELRQTSSTCYGCGASRCGLGACWGPKQPHEVHGGEGVGQISPTSEGLIAPNNLDPDSASQSSILGGRINPGQQDLAPSKTKRWWHRSKSEGCEADHGQATPPSQLRAITPPCSALCRRPAVLAPGTLTGGRTARTTARTTPRCVTPSNFTPVARKRNSFAPGLRLTGSAARRQGREGGKRSRTAENEKDMNAGELVEYGFDGTNDTRPVRVHEDNIDGMGGDREHRERVHTDDRDRDEPRQYGKSSQELVPIALHRHDGHEHER